MPSKLNLAGLPAVGRGREKRGIGRQFRERNRLWRQVVMLRGRKSLEALQQAGLDSGACCPQDWAGR